LSTKKTGVASTDNEAEANGVYGLTLPIITETTTEEEARHLPRAPFTEMWQFIFDDLQKAEEYLADYVRPADKKNLSRLGSGVRTEGSFLFGDGFTL
jgi:hypothetical protein